MSKKIQKKVEELLFEVYGKGLQQETTDLTAYYEKIQQALNIPVVSVSILMIQRKQWYLDNEYDGLSGELPPFIRLKLDTDLRRDKAVLDWLYSR